MSKHICLFIAIMVSVSLDAQIKKGTFLVGGQIGYYNSNVKVPTYPDQKTRNSWFDLSAGRAFKENKVAGILFAFYPADVQHFFTGNDTVNSRFRRYDAGLFYRQYKRLAKDLYFLVELSTRFTSAKRTDKYAVTGNKIDITQKAGLASLTPGISYEIFKNLQLEVLLPNILTTQYITTKVTSQNQPANNFEEKQFIVYSNLSSSTPLGYLGVGLRFLF